MIKKEQFVEIKAAIRCVYKLVFDSGNFYIGSTIDLKARLSQHCSKIKRGKMSLSDYHPYRKGDRISHAEILHLKNGLRLLRRLERKEIAANRSDTKLTNPIRGSQPADTDMIDLLKQRVRGRTLTR